MTAHHAWKPVGAALGLAASLTAGAWISSAQSAPVFNDPADVKAITAIEDDLQTQIDMKNVIDYYAPDATVIDMFSPAVYRGRDQIFAYFQPQFAPVQSMTHSMQEINVAAGENLACAAMEIHFDTKLKNGQSMAMTVREIDAFKKIGGKWRIIEQHISLPTDPKTGMAVMDGPLPTRGPLVWADNPIPAPTISSDAAKVEIRNWMDVGALSTSIDQMMAYYGPDDDTLVYDTFAPGEMRGLKEIHDYYAPLLGSYNGIKVKMPVFVADSDGSFGVQIDTQDMKLAMKDGSTRYISLRQSDCVRRVNGKWYSFFEMVSYPVDPKTGKSTMENPAAFQ